METSTPLSVVIASLNPVKIRAVQSAFGQAFPNQSFAFTSAALPSGVAAQPMSDAETRLGAQNRAFAAQQTQPEADYWVGVEGGIAEMEEYLEAFAWIVVRGKDQIGYGRTAGFMLPPAIAELVRGGMELGVADDVVFGTTNSKQANGAIGLLTHNLLTRETLYRPALLMALIPFFRPELYPAVGADRPEKGQ